MKRNLVVLLSLAAFVALLMWSPDTLAYDRYYNSSGTGNCSTCHGSFTGATSPMGSEFPSDNKHRMHNGSSSMNAECDLCHTSGDGRNPWIGSSDGTTNNTGLGCSGCHGRLEDAGNDSVSDGLGAGLRQHHYNAGTTTCAACHTDSNPANYTAVGEDIRPPYYGTADTNVSMPCNAVAESNVNENWTIGDFLGSDNDGDGLYDASDPDCMATPESACFDGLDNDSDGLTDCADPDCAEAIGDACDTGDPGICSAGTSICSGGAEECLPDSEPQTEGPPGNATCSDGLDNDCDALTDSSDPDCMAAPEANCFDGVDNDFDGLTDCADPDCAEAIGDACDTGDPGICSAGTSTCSSGAEECVPDSEPQTEGPPGNASCSDGLDNDCDALTDTSDPDCMAMPETACFDGLDNDSDGLTDCADPDCEGNTDGACDTGDPGICSAGTSTCSGGAEECVPDSEPQTEGPSGDATCTDGLDNDCDALSDSEDPDCMIIAETECFDGMDNDSDGLSDCADSDCEGSIDGACDTGDPGICSAGASTCSGGAEECVPDSEPQTEGPAGDTTCSDGLDNDCDALSDSADPDCTVIAETECFDGLDNDSDGLFDCADPDCERSEGGACNTGEPGICAVGTLICTSGQQVCVQDLQAEPESNDSVNCDDGLDNDCDGLTDLEDPECVIEGEADCFDGVDNDSDGLMDCSDPDCEGSEDGSCDTGEPGVCASGTYVCMNAMQTCMGNEQAQPEGDMYDNCQDGLDNDCDGFADNDDADCTMMEADVWLRRLIAHQRVNLQEGQTKRRRIFAQARADTKPQAATVTLSADYDPAGVSVDIPQDSRTQTLDVGEDGGRMFMFWPLVTCNAVGSYTVSWTAEIDAPENREAAGDVLVEMTVINCRENSGNDSNRSGHGNSQRPRKSRR